MRTRFHFTQTDDKVICEVQETTGFWFWKRTQTRTFTRPRGADWDEWRDHNGYPADMELSLDIEDEWDAWLFRRREYGETLS